MEWKQGIFRHKIRYAYWSKMQNSLFITVKRAIDCEERWAHKITFLSYFYRHFYRRKCFVTMESTSFKSRFMTQINNSFGSGDMSCLNEAQFSAPCTKIWRRALFQTLPYIYMGQPPPPPEPKTESKTMIRERANLNCCKSNCQAGNDASCLATRWISTN